MEGRFIDASVLVAAFVVDDGLHERALKELALVPRPFLIHEYVALETATVLGMRYGKDIADTFMEAVLHNADFELVPSSVAFFRETAGVFIENKKLSFTDAALLALSSEYQVVTFDEALGRAIKKGQRGR